MKIKEDNGGFDLPVVQTEKIRFLAVHKDYTVHTHSIRRKCEER